MGGIYVEALRDVAFRLAPFDRREAREMLGEIRAHNLLRGVRGEQPVDREAIVDTLLRLSQLAGSFSEIVEFEINPLTVFEEGQGVIGIDMRLVLGFSASKGGRSVPSVRDCAKGGVHGFKVKTILQHLFKALDLFLKVKASLAKETFDDLDRR